ncbi:EAL domain-containing protein [Cellulomonas sp. APG4]|uniref:bifunctional diguanylate cyclase/phosphodiesterase n=1 Tax=Cellulomonas sp. APG4 TaxID=1538656 RepID=UPI00137AEE29|nr:EAL domain-containing protein [Cellulomonas sp. APG4]NCT91797.1 EAL domain-containing protein [Cellulomonas sp. APG4]
MGPSSVRRVAAALASYGLLTYVGLGAAVFGLAAAAVALAPPDTGVAAWWPAAGVSVIAIAWAPTRARRLVAVAVVAVLSAVANVVAGREPAVAAGFGLANALEAFVVAWWLTRDGRRPSLRSLEDVFRLFVATAMGIVTMGALAGATVAFGTDGGFLVTARTVMTSHGAAILVIVPFGMRVLGSRAPGRGFEAALQWAAVVVATVVIFGPEQTLPLSFLTMPLLVWGALRLGTRTVTTQLLVLGVLLTWLSRTGGGPFAARLGEASTASTSLVQAYMVAAALIMLPVAVSVAQRRAALERVEASERLFRLGFSEALLGTLLLRRCEAGHVDTRAEADLQRRGGRREPGAEPAEAPADGLGRHRGGGLDVVELNPVAARILGSSETDLVGTSWTGRLEEGDRAMLTDAVAAIAEGRLAGWHGELALVGWDGTRWVEVAISPLPSSAGDGLFVAQMVDVTSRRAAEDRLTAQALQDSLTGLGNRTLLRDRIDLALRTLPEGAGVVVLFCDLDDFKHVNDTAGHTNGDVVLVEVAERLRSLLRPDDVAARQGGDEFVVLRPHARGPEEGEELAAEVLEALAAPTMVGGRPFSVGASIGIAWGTAGARADDLLRDADAAMYAAKEAGKRRAVVYSDEHRARATRAVELEAELREALDRDELEVYLQPVVDLLDGRTTAAEALVRWRHPTRGVLAPAEWLDVAEASGLMPRVGAWVLERACRLAVGWPADDVQVHVNVSARQLDEPDFLDVVSGVLARTGLPPARLVLEFTETHLDAVSDALLTDLAALRRIGIGLAADDYGTGYSPLTRVIELPISMIKVDRLFVAAMLDDVRSRAIVTTLVRLGQSLGLDLVAEGVETEAQAAELRRLGCTSAQGYLWSRPVPADEFRLSLLAPPVA